jgi:hypothetical protein
VLGDAKSSPGDAESSLGDAKSSLGDAESSLGDVQVVQGLQASPYNPLAIAVPMQGVRVRPPRAQR